MTTYKTLAAGMICRDHSFTFRYNDNQPDLVRTLVAILRRGTKLDPILVWREQDASGALTGRNVLLDGAQRMKAYNSLRKTERIPVEFFAGTKADAAEMAVSLNAKVSVGLTAAERTNAAWRLVWDHGYDLSKARIMRAAGVSAETVAKMRRRAKVLREAEQDVTGEWRRDCIDLQNDHVPFDDDKYEQERQALKVKLVEGLQKVLGFVPKTDTELFFEVMSEAVGDHHLGLMFEYGFADVIKGSSGVSISPVTGAMGDEEQPDDVNPDF